MIPGGNDVKKYNIHADPEFIRGISDQIVLSAGMKGPRLSTPHRIDVHHYTVSPG